MRKPIIAIIGRPNVGKSTLFNRIIGERLAIVENTPGVTRDRHYAPCTIDGRDMIFVDTGGLEPGATEGLLPQMRVQTEIALDEADFIFFVLDNQEGLLPSDREIHDLLRKAHKPVFYVVNKVDGPKAESAMTEFFSLGVEKLYPVSAEHGRGLDDLLEDLFRRFPIPPSHVPEETPEESDPQIPRIAVVGRPNVGKSTLINTLLHKERLVTSPIPGTTRDSIDTLVTYHKRKYCFIDTAGMRRKSKVDRGVETYSVLRALRSIDECDLVLLVVDGMEGVTDQEARIVQYIQEAGKGTLLLINKWDLVPKDHRTADQYTKLLLETYPFLSYMPLIFLSALKGQRIPKIFQGIDQVTAAYSRRIPTSQINKFFEDVLEQAHLPSVAGKDLRVYYGTQIGIRPPSFVLFTNRPQSIPKTYTRFIEHRLREKWGFEGVPLRIKWRKK